MSLSAAWQSSRYFIDYLHDFDIYAGVLDALGVPAERIPAQAGLDRSLVADKRMLIVLENARDEASASSGMPARLSPDLVAGDPSERHQQCRPARSIRTADQARPVPGGDRCPGPPAQLRHVGRGSRSPQAGGL